MGPCTNRLVYAILTAVKTPRSLRLVPFLITTLLVTLFHPGGTTLAQTLPYQVGGIVGTNFGLQNRFRWTNDAGTVYTPSNTTIRLRDFDGKIVFYVFFDVW